MKTTYEAALAEERAALERLIAVIQFDIENGELSGSRMQEPFIAGWGLDGDVIQLGVTSIRLADPQGAERAVASMAGVLNTRYDVYALEGISPLHCVTAVVDPRKVR